MRLKRIIRAMSDKGRIDTVKGTGAGKPYSSADHTFAICAYGDSAYLEECIESLKNQKLKSNIIMCTSTPSDFLKDTAEKHGIRLYINEAAAFKSNIASDWNYAIDCADTPLVTIAHQDDLYKPDYALKIVDGMNRSSHPLIAFTDYAELRDGREVSDIRNLNIKRIMLFPLRSARLWRSKFVRRRILSFGSAICCPSVTYVKGNLPVPPFIEGYKVNLDWQAWERFSRLKGDFVFVNDILMAHRIHRESETTRNISDNNRTAEDYEMFCRFWPKWIAGILEHWYKKGEEQNDIQGI